MLYGIKMSVEPSNIMCEQTQAWDPDVGIISDDEQRKCIILYIICLLTTTSKQKDPGCFFKRGLPTVNASN